MSPFTQGKVGYKEAAADIAMFRINDRHQYSTARDNSRKKHCVGDEDRN